MQEENKLSKIMWDAMREIMKDEGENISFSEMPEGYSVTPNNIRWKNFFLNNLFWSYRGKYQKNMIILSEEISQITTRFEFETMDVKKYLNELTNIDFSIYLTDSDKSRKTLQVQLIDMDKNYAIITQERGQIEEYIATIATKLYFAKLGYLVGEFEIPGLLYSESGLTDVIGIKGDFVNKLKANGIVPNGGDESELLIWKELEEEPVHTDEKNETIVCEVKSSGAWNSAFEQLYFRGGNAHKPGYLKSHCFDKGYACFGAETYANQKKPRAIYEAGYLIFTGYTQPIIFQEDPISSTPSSKRREASVLVKEKCQSDLIELANKHIARLMISSLPAEKIIPNIGNLSINKIFKEIDNLRVETVLERMK